MFLRYLYMETSKLLRLFLKIGIFYYVLSIIFMLLSCVNPYY